MWKALVHVRRSEKGSEKPEQCILDADQRGGYINVKVDKGTRFEFESFVRDYLRDYGVEVAEFLEVEEEIPTTYDGLAETETITLGTLHTYAADDA